MGKTIQETIDVIVSAVPGAPYADSVDTFKSGDPFKEVTGIVTTFIATHDVIRQAIALGANLIITHEPTYYNHWDRVDWLQDNSVYNAKRSLIEENGITIWRFHDYWHLHQPDGIVTGLVKALGWEAYQDPENASIFDIPPMTLAQLAAALKEKFSIPVLRVVGCAEMACRHVALLVGAMPGEMQIAFLDQDQVDVLICGETAEWQTCEYVRDAIAFGQNKALVLLGHERTEEPGMGFLVEWLRPQLPGIPITHVPAGDPVEFA